MIHVQNEVHKSYSVDAKIMQTTNISVMTIASVINFCDDY